MRSAAALLLALVPAALAAQTPAPAAPKPAVHRTASTTGSTLPPSIPKVVGVTRSLYSLRYIDTKIGTGALAKPSILGTSRADSTIMFYTVHYTGWLAKDGKKFDSSFDHPGKEPIIFPFGVRQVIPGWDTGFDGMRIGGKRRLFIPYQLAYGDSAKPPVIPAKSDLIFDIELMAISDKPPAQPAPPAPPAAQRPTPPAPSSPATPPQPAAPATPPSATPSPAEKPMTDPATNDPAKATTPDNAAPKPGTKPQTP